MKLNDIVDNLLKYDLINGIIPENELLEHEVSLVSCSSSEVVANTVFFVKGATFKAEYLADAVKKGAFVYISEKEFPEVSIPWIPVSNVRKAIAYSAPLFYDNPAEKLEVIGLTGTKGKSTTAYFIKTMLDAYLEETERKESGLMSSIETFDGKERFISHLTTPEPLDLQKHFANCVEEKIDFMTMEVSSQALKYDRVLGLTFDVACFLNIDYDHISPIEHPDWEDYFTSKLRIFDQCKTAVVNLDSEHIERILKEAAKAERRITYSILDESADIYACNIRKENGFTVFNVRYNKFNCNLNNNENDLKSVDIETVDSEYRLSIPGLFNVSNALCAIAVALCYGIPEQIIHDSLETAKVPGRMEVYENKDRSLVAIVDFAHNRLSFEKLMESAGIEYPGYRKVIVFGCPGNKAYHRRKDLGQVAGMYADFAYITEDDPGEENPEDICREIATYVEEQGCAYTINTNRNECIRKAVLEAEVPTVFLLAGKGADTFMKRGREYVPVMSDAETVIKAFAEREAR